MIDIDAEFIKKIKNYQKNQNIYLNKKMQLKKLLTSTEFFAIKEEVNQLLLNLGEEENELSIEELRGAGEKIRQEIKQLEDAIRVWNHMHKVDDIYQKVKDCHDALHKKIDGTDWSLIDVFQESQKIILQNNKGVTQEETIKNPLL